MQARIPSAILVALLLVSTPGCGHRDPAAPTSSETIGIWSERLRTWLGIEDGSWSWRWSGKDGSAGDAEMVIAGRRYLWRLDGAPPRGGIALKPASARWLAIRVPGPADLSATPPLPRLACDSAAFPDLVALLCWLITPRFDGRVVHWPDWPVPVCAPAAVSGGLDLAACLREAVTIWNQGASPFVWDDDATWGVRLAHYAGSSRRPTMQLQITRLDDAGRPLRARIAVGDDYDADERIFAIRAMAHELAHAALLWGHSPDRDHLLWAAAPPLRSDPSADERRAAELLRLLPEGLDLSRYGPANASTR